MKILFIAALAFLSLPAFAQPQSAKAGVTYGKGTTAEGAIDVNLLDGKLAGSDEFTGKVTGTVVSVCLQKGCWMKLAQANGDGIMIRFKDYKFFMPKDIVGKQVVLEGTAEKTTTSVEMLKHYAEDAHKPQSEIDKITEPKTEVEFIATGVLVVS